MGIGWECGMSHTERINYWAREIGFDKVGIAAVDTVSGGAQLAEWLMRGYHAGMGWMLNNAYRRLDPRCVLPGAQSVICVAVNYYTSGERDVDGLKVSRYAWGTDYHHILGRMLKELAARISQEHPDSSNLWYVDTGPVMEKTWAQRAGLGWIGKNDILISRDFGTWLFLGEVITTLDLPPDLPEQDHCGTCTRCIDACPTDAIVEPYVVDANRCSAYWTIEHRGEFPPAIADTFDGWVFGCDICQEVCPFNRFQQDTALPVEFGPRSELLPPERWLEFSREDFARLSLRSPLRRARLEGLQRNVRATRGACNQARTVAEGWQQGS